MKKSMFNEDNYLNNDSIIKIFEDINIDRKQKWDLEKYKYYKTIDKYKEFIEEVAMFIKKIGYHSVLDCSSIIAFLIYQGYLSNDLSFTDKELNSEKEISCLLGSSIIKGKGCCRNLSQIHKDIFQNLNLESNLLYCYEGVRLLGLEKNRQANHVINLVKHEENLYGIDLYNGNHLFHFISGLELEQISSRNNDHLLYKPYYEIIQGESNLEDIKEKIQSYKDYSLTETIKPLYYEFDIIDDTKKRVLSLREECFNFHEKTKTLKKEIIKGMDKL